MSWTQRCEILYNNHKHISGSLRLWKITNHSRYCRSAILHDRWRHFILYGFHHDAILYFSGRYSVIPSITIIFPMTTESSAFSGNRTLKINCANTKANCASTRNSQPAISLALQMYFNLFNSNRSDSNLEYPDCIHRFIYTLCLPPRYFRRAKTQYF